MDWPDFLFQPSITVGLSRYSHLSWVGVIWPGSGRLQKEGGRIDFFIFYVYGTGGFVFEEDLEARLNGCLPIRQGFNLNFLVLNLPGLVEFFLSYSNPSFCSFEWFFESSLFPKVFISLDFGNIFLTPALFCP